MSDDAVPRWRRLVPVLALLALAPWAAECSWGGFTAVDSLFVVLILAPMYGGAAVLIRETARRTGGGWPAIVLLAAAFGMFQAGLVDQALFNSDFLDDTEFAGSAAAATATEVPVLGFSAQQAYSYIGTHIALSICTPIAIVESFLCPRRRYLSWLRPGGLVVIGIGYLLGSWVVFSDIRDTENYLAGPGQAAFAAAVVAALIGLALLPRWRRRRPPVTARAPRPVWAALPVAGAYLTTELVPGWPGLALQLAAVTAAAALIVRWSRRAGWGQRHVLALWSGALVTAAVGAYGVPNYEPSSPTEALVGDITISVVTLALLGGAFWRLLRRPAAPAPSTPGQPGTPVHTAVDKPSTDR
jgi:hypothetical protein